MIVHYSLPILSDEYNENPRESHVKLIKIWPRCKCLNAIINIFLRRNQFIFIESYLVAKQFHSKQRENEHADAQQARERNDFLHSLDHSWKEQSEACPASGQFKHSQETDASESRECAAGTSTDLGNLQEYEVNEWDDDEYGVKNVESVPRVFLEAETDDFDDHLCDEAPAKNIVKSLRDLLALQIARVAIQSQYKRVCHDQ